jgi:putrescine transport system permease protein
MRTAGHLRRIGVTGRGLVVALPFVWLLLFFVVPFVIVLKISFSDIDLAIPPYKPLLEWVGKNSLAIKVNFNNYAFLFTDRLYINAFLNSIKVAFISTVFCLLVGYPMAYGHTRHAQPAAVAGHPAVLDFAAAAGLCLDRPVEGERRDQQRADLARGHS